MKLKIFTFLSICILYLNISIYANENYEIATWFDFKQSALTYTYDDNTPNQVNVAIPLMDEFNFKGTFYVVTGWSPNWTAFQQASNNGHEIGGHTVSHPHFNELSDDELTTEIVNSQTIINENIQGESCVTIAYPFCETGNIDIISAHYIAGRVCDARIEPATPNNFYEISSIVCGTEGLNTPQALNNKANETKEANGWNVFLMHGIDNDQGTYSPIASSTLKEHFEYVAQNDKDYWVAPFRDVVKYIKLRNDVTIEEDSVSQDSLMIMLSTTLDSEIYDTEISFRRAIPNEWKFINVYSKSGNKTFHVTTIDNQKYITIHSNVDNNDTIFVVNDIVTSGATYPPSSVITAPHVNAYFQENNNIVINVYATDLGKSLYNGHVTEVEFYVGDSIIGKSTIHKNNTFSITWENVPQGEYIITAKATNNRGISFTSASVIITVGEDEVPAIGLSSNKGKYLGNITGSAGIYDYLNFWNGVTAENACKWGSIERTRDVMNWGGADGTYNLAKNNHLMYRYHAIAWGSQYPTWIVDLTPEEFQKEIEEYMDTIAKRYPLMDQIDVLNENMNLTTWNGEEHAAGTPYFRAGMGGPGETGYDWAIWLFEKAREHFPNSKLVMNDFGLENSPNSIREMLDVVKVLRDRGLIDGFGTQAHTFNVDGFRTSPNTLRQRVDLMATSGIPVYVTELDLTGNSSNAGSEDLQLESYKNILPVYWEHPAVAGVTLWGYVSGATWRAGTGLLDVQTDGTRKDRKAMLWIKEYFGTMENVGYPFGVPEPYIPPVDTTDTTTNIDKIVNHELIIFPNPTDGKINIQANNEIKKIDVIDINGKKIKSIKTKNILGKELDITDLEEGNYILNVYTKSKNYSYKILKK